MSVWLTKPPSTPAAPQWLRDLVAARTHYEELLSWPVTVKIEPRRLAMAAGQKLDAVTMPATLGQVVLAELHITVLTAPVIGQPGGARWTFLTAPTSAPGPEIPAELRVHEVHVTLRGTQVIIPGLDDAEASLWWIARPPQRHTLPPWSVVIASTRRVVNRLNSTGRR